MSEEVKVQGTEGIVATPEQEAFNLKNEATFNNPVDIKISAYDPNITINSMETNFRANEDWRNFLADEKRYVRKAAPQSYKAFRQIEKMWRQPEYASIVDMYGSDMAVAGQMLSDYVDWDKVPWWERQKIGIRAARYGLKINAAKTKLYELEQNGGSSDEIQAAQNEVSRLEEYFQHNARPYDSDQANAWASMGVSAARVIPEMVATAAAISAATATLGGAAPAAGVATARLAATLGGALGKAKKATDIAKSLKTARAIQKATRLAGGAAQGLANYGIVYGDTYNVTMGQVYDRVRSENPLLSDEQVYDLARTSADLQAKMEATPALLGLGFRAAASSELALALRSVASKVPTDVLKRAAFMKAFQEETNSLIGKKIAQGWLGEAATDILTEVAQQAAENATIKIAADGGVSDDVLAATLSRLGGFVMDPFNEEYADELNTLLSVTLPSLGFGGIAPGVAYINHKARQKSFGNRLSDLYRNQKFGADLRAFTQANQDKMGVKALNEMITGMGNRGDAPRSVFFDKAAVQQLVDTDAEFRSAMERLGVMKELKESDGNGGVIEIPLTDYNSIVNGEKSGTLYSKVKDMVTFSIDSMTMSQLNEWLSSVEAQNKAEIKKAVANPNSVYNKTMQYLADIKEMTDDQRKANATLMQLIANRVAASKTNPITGEQWFEENVLLTRSDRDQFVLPEGALQDFEAVDQSKLTTFTPEGKLKDEVWNRIRALFTEEKLKQKFTKQGDGEKTATFEDLLKSTFATPEGASRQYLQSAIKRVSDIYGISPSQMTNAIRIARGQEAAKTTLYQFAGSLDEKTLNAIAERFGKKSELDEAKSLEKKSIDEGSAPDYEAIWQKTGWYKEADGSWSYETSDEKASLNLDKIVTKTGKIKSGKIGQLMLGDILNHPDLFKILPELKTIPVYIGKSTVSGVTVPKNSFAVYVPTYNEIVIKKSDLQSAAKEGKSVHDFALDSLMHEVQHAIQWTQNMMRAPVGKKAKGIPVPDITAEQTKNLKELYDLRDKIFTDIVNKYNIKLAANAKKNSRQYFGNRNVLFAAAQTEAEKKLVRDFVDKYIETQDYNIRDNSEYWRKAHEVQARNTEYRLSLTEDQRRQVSPSATVDIGGQTQVGYAPNAAAVPMQTRQLRVMKFAGVPVEAATNVPVNVSGLPTTGEKVAGWFDVIDGKYVLSLTDKWNATTFSHEAFHMYSRALQDEYNAGTMTSYWRTQTEKLFKTVDAKPDQNGNIVLTKAQEELLAERFTTYLLNNKIENPELNSIFALLRDAFDKTYKQLQMQEHQPDAKTKEAFAVIFGAQDVVVAEQRALGLLEIPKPAGVSQEAYDHYMSFLLESRAKATHDMIKTYYAVEKYKNSKKYGELYDATYTANLKAVEQEPRFQVKAIAKQINSTDPNDVMMAYNDTHPNALLTMDDIVAALDDTANMTEIAEQRTAEMMDEHIKQEFKIPDNQTLVSKDLKNVAMAKAFLMEALMNEGKDWSDFDSEYTKLLNAVENQIQKMPLSKLQNSRRWSQLESVYAQQYQMYAATGQTERASQVRRAQAQVVLIQNKMFEMNNRVDRFLEKFPKKLRNAQPQGKSIMSAESWDLLQSLMEQYGFRILDKRRSAEPFNIKLDNWLKNIEDSEYCPISNLRYFLPETAQGHQGSFGSMTVRQFEVLEHVSTAINSLASREYNLITEAEKIKYDTLVALTAKRLQEKGIKPYEKDDTWFRKNFGILSNIVNPEPILKALFPEEVMQNLVRPLFSAAAREEVSYNEWNERWNQMVQKVNLSEHKKQYSTGHILSYNNVGNLLLAMGNEHAYENWRLYLGLDEAQAEAIIAEALVEQPQLAEFANKYWKLMSETSDLMNDSYRKRYNKLFVKKQPRAFKIGQYEFTGGYVPESKLVAALPENTQWESIVMGELGNEKLINDKPDGKDLLSIVDNTRSRLKLFARWGHVAPEFNNFVRFVQRDDVGAIIGSRAQNYIKGWLRDYHTPAGDSAGLMHALMAATTTGVLGLRLPQALLQLSGFIPAMGLLGRGGMRYMFGSMGRIFAGGITNQVERARSNKRSDYMQARYADPVKTLFGVSKAEMQISKAIGKFQKFAMSMISYMDAIVANTTWDASYRMALDDGLTEKEAAEKADQNVRLSQTDALSISRSRAMKSDWARIITPFSTYMMGMQSVVRGRIAENEYMGALAFFISYTVASTMVEAMMKEIPMPWEDEDDEKYVERFLKRWYNDGISTGGSTLYPIAGLGSDFAKGFAWAVESIINPEEKPATDMWSGGSVAALTYAKQYRDAMRYGMVGIFNGDEDAQRKAIANFVGWFSSGGKKIVKDVLED